MRNVCNGCKFCIAKTFTDYLLKEVGNDRQCYVPTDRKGFVCKRFPEEREIEIADWCGEFKKK